MPETCDNSTLLRRRCRRFHGDGATLILAGHAGRPPFARCQLDAHRLGAAENMPDGRHLAAVTDQEFRDRRDATRPPSSSATCLASFRRADQS